MRTPASYVVEWRALSQSIGGNRRLLDRSGRFEDLYVRTPVTSGSTLALSVGQFRALTQIDVSQRLSLSEPLVFSAGLPGRRATTSRFTAATVPLTGELTIPFTEAASFELEGRPKGVFVRELLAIGPELDWSPYLYR